MTASIKDTVRDGTQVFLVLSKGEFGGGEGREDKKRMREKYTNGRKRGQEMRRMGGGIV